MDPQAALVVVRDEQANIQDRLEAAFALFDWIRRHGYSPPGLSIHQSAELWDLPARIHLLLKEI